MDKEKTIEEIENLISCQPTTASENVETNGERIYNAGYRKFGICKWHKVHEDWTGVYFSNCAYESTIPEFNPIRNHWHYCPYCGNKIKIVEDEDG